MFDCPSRPVDGFDSYFASCCMSFPNFVRVYVYKTCYLKWKVMVMGERLILLVMAMARGICDPLVTLSSSI